MTTLLLRYYSDCYLFQSTNYQMLFRLSDHLQLEDSNEWIEVKMKYLSDAFYLAYQRIYGDLNEVSTNLKNYLSQFGDYVKYLSI